MEFINVEHVSRIIHVDGKPFIGMLGQTYTRQLTEASMKELTEFINVEKIIKMVTILKVIAVNGEVRTSHYPAPGDGVFPTVEMAREFYKNEFKTNKIMLCYVSK